VRNHIRTLCAAIVALIALVFTAQVADADSMEEITAAHRGAATSQFGEGTLPAYRYAVKTMRTLDGDIRWTKDGSDADQPGTMVILHDTTLDRVTNCSGTVSSWLQSSTRDSCSTKVGGQRLMRLVDLLRYGNSLESHSPWQSRFLRSPTHRPSSCGMRSRTPGCRCRRHRPNLLHWTRSLSSMPPIPATVSATA